VPLNILVPPAGSGVCRDRRWIRKFGRQPVPKSIVAQGAANEHFAGFDRGGQLQNRHDFQLSAVEGFAILRIIVHEALPFSGQPVRPHAICEFHQLLSNPFVYSCHAVPIDYILELKRDSPVASSSC